MENNPAPKTKILVIEDNTVTRKVVRLALSAAGFDVLEATDGRSALESVIESSPDLILQDLVLPDIDGFQLAKKIRSLPEGIGVPLLAFSAFISKIEEAQKLPDCFNGFVVKPVEPSRLVASIRQYLRQTAIH